MQLKWYVGILAVAGLAGCGGSGSSAPSYSTTYTATLVPSFEVRKLSANGTVFGQVNEATSGPAHYRAKYWTPSGGLIDVGRLLGEAEVTCEVSGHLYGRSAVWRSGKWVPYDMQSFLPVTSWGGGAPGNVTALGTSISLEAANDSGDIVALVDDTKLYVLTTSGTIVPITLKSAGGQVSTVVAMNNNRNVVGSSFRTYNGAIFPLINFDARGIGKDDVVVGQRVTTQLPVKIAADGTQTVLPIRADGSIGSANGINERGLIVGFTDSATGNRACVWQSGVQWDLTDLTKSGLPSGVTLYNATHVNGSGSILATGNDGNTYLLKAN